MLAKLKGKKTFIICGASILWAILGAVLGLLEPVDALNVSLAAMGAAGLRDALR